MKHRARGLATGAVDGEQWKNRRWQEIAPEKMSASFPAYMEDKPRLCTDIPCLILLATALMVLLIVSISVWAFGNPLWLIAGWNFQAQICGVDAEVASLPFVYWPLPDELGDGHCVRACPSFDDFANSTMVPVLRPEPLLVQESVEGARVMFSQTLWSQTVAMYPSVPAVGRFCLPAPHMAMSLANSSRSHDARRLMSHASTSPPQVTERREADTTAHLSTLDGVRGQLGCTACQLRRGVGSLWIVRWRLVALAIIMPFLLGTALAGLACCSPDYALWFVVLGAAIGSLALGCSILAGVFSSQSADDFILPTLDSVQLLLAWAVGWVLVSLSFAMFCISFASRHLLQWVAACMQVIVGIVSNSGLCLPLASISILLALVQSCVALLWIWLLSAAVSSAAVGWSAELPSMEGDARSIFSKMQDSVDDESEIVPGGPLVRGLRKEPVFRWHPAPVILISTLVLHTLQTLFVCMSQYLVASIVSRWYFFGSARPQRRWPGFLCKSCEELVCAHMGSVVSGTLFIAFLPLSISSICTQLLHKRLAPWRTSLRAPGLHSKRQTRGCARRLGACFGTVCVATSSAPYVEVALNACHFHTAVKTAAASLPQAIPSLQFLFGLPGIFQVAVGTFSSLAAAALLLLSVQGQEHKTPGYVEIELGIALLATVLASSPASVWASVNAAAFDAMSLCFMLDDFPGEQLSTVGQGKLKQPFEDARDIDAGVGLGPTSRGLWSSGYTPPLFRALLMQADQMLQSMGRGGEAIRAPEGYAAVGESSDSESDMDSS